MIDCVIWCSLMNDLLTFHLVSTVFLQAVKLTSEVTQLPYEYYYLPICRPKEIEYQSENFGKK